MNKIQSLFILASLVVASVAASAQERLVLRYHGQQYRGQSTLTLKQEIRNQYPHMNVRNLELESVRLVAKTRHGQGTASLMVGHNTTHERRVYGNPQDFHLDQRYTWDRVDFYNPSHSDRGRWQIHLRGNFKVKRVVLRVRRGHSGGGFGQYVDVLCSSFNRRYTTCPTGGQILDAYVAQQYSNASCIRGVSWGINYDTIWVDNGCRANFQVRIGGHIIPPRPLPPIHPVPPVRPRPPIRPNPPVRPRPPVRPGPRPRPNPPRF